MPCPCPSKMRVMRLFCFSDLHNDLGAGKRLGGEALVANVDLLISAGDLAVDGRHDPQLYRELAWAGRPVFAIPGNHDRDGPYRVASAAAGWFDLDGRVIEQEGFWFAGHGFAVSTGAYSGPDASRQSEDPFLTQLLAQLEAMPRERIILVTHLPPWGTLAARDHKFIDRGNVQLQEWVERRQPLAVICGHVHHPEASMERLGETLVVNPGPHGQMLVL